MKVTAPITFEPSQRLQVAQFLGRPGELATRAELIAFAQQSVERRLGELTKPSAAMERPKS